MIKSCVVFSVSVASSDKLFVLEEFLDTLQKYYSDTKIFIGINITAHPDIESIIARYDLDCEVQRLKDERLYVSADPAGYQLALKMFLNSKEKFDVIWFMHTKGGYNPRDMERKLYLENFYPKKEYIENKFKQLPKLGVYGYRGIKYDWIHKHPYLQSKRDILTERLVQDIWGDAPSKLFKYSICPLLIIETMFAMRAEIMYKFLEEYPEFLHTPMNKLTQETEARYYFEGEICNFIPTRMGYYPAVIERNLFLKKEDAQPLVREWISENDFKEYELYESSLYGEMK